MPRDAFKIRKGEQGVEIVGVGLVDEEHNVPLDRAAERMPALQAEDGKPLSGAALVNAAKAWAEQAGNGLQVGKSSGSEDAAASAGAGDNDAPAAAPDNEE